MSHNIFDAIFAVAWLQTAAALVSTFSKTMIRLRWASVLANVLGAVVGAALGNLAILVRHLVILPIDALRLRQMCKLVASVKAASETDLNVEWLKPFMNPHQFKQDEVIFGKGEAAGDAFMLIAGDIELVEIGVVLSPGALFGEMALFTKDGRRTATARCRTNCQVLSITYEQFEQLYFQNPKFGLYLVRLIVRRLDANLAEAKGIA